MIRRLLSWFSGPKPKAEPEGGRAAFDPFPLDQTLLQLSPHAADALVLRDVLEGVQIIGATGSGKTSGSGAALARAFLASGFGGLVLTTKIDEPNLWRSYAAATGRSGDLVFFGPAHTHRFNFLQYEATRPGPGAGSVENLVELFLTLLEASESGEGKSSEKFWDRSVRQLLRNTIGLLRLAGQPLSMPVISDVIRTAPRSPDSLHDPDWQKQSLCWQCLEAAHHQRGLDYDIIEAYWLGEFPEQDERTRSNIIMTFSTMADLFCRGELRELFGTKLTLLPEFSHHGAVILLDLPVKRYGQVGRFAQVLFKHLWQQAVERRDVARNPRPVFLWCDEAQEFIVKHDMLYQATARSARAATVYLTQTISAYYARLGHAGSGRDEADAFLANLATKIFHANSGQTNEWAERLLAKEWTYRAHSSVSSSSPNSSLADSAAGSSQGRDRSSVSSGVNPSLESHVLASWFTTLRKGGPASGWLVDALIFQTGRIWAASRKNHLKVTFRQEGP